MMRKKSILVHVVRGAVVWLILPAAAVLVLRLVWEAQAQRRLAATVAELKARGLCVAAADFPDASGIPPAENAAIVLAPSAMGWSSAEQELIGKTYERQTPVEHAAILKVFDSHPDLLPRIDAAGACPQTVWPREIFTDPTWISRHSVGGWVMTGKLLHNAALVEHARGNDLAALRYLERLDVMMRVVQQSPVLLFNLVAQIFREELAQGVEDLAPALALDDPEVRTAAQRLLANVLDDRQAFVGMAYGWQGQIVETMGTLHDPALPTWAPWIQRPLLIDILRRRIESAATATAFQPRDLRRPLPRASAANLPQILNLGNEGIFAMALDRYQRTAKTVTHSRAAGLLLGARIYRAAHGRLPTAAAELVPEILPAIPTDPYSDTKAPLRYRLSTPSYPLVWSVGENKRDDEGSLQDLLYPAPSIVSAASRPSPATTRPIR